MEHAMGGRLRRRHRAGCRNPVDGENLFHCEQLPACMPTGMQISSHEVLSQKCRLKFDNERQNPAHGRCTKNFKKGLACRAALK
jgi:hypothetical protein